MWIVLSLFVVYVIFVGALYLLQDKMVYHPTKAIAATPSVLGYEYEEVEFTTEDGVRLHGWFVPKQSAGLTVLYFHGNAGNISGRLETIQLLHELGLNVFIFDYRGYGKSEGTPSEQGTYKDARAAWDYLQSVRSKPDSSIVIMGRSLGGSIAAWLATQKSPAASIIESTFTSAADLGAEIYPWLPVHWMIKYEYNTLANIQKVTSPLFMAHSRDDQIVPFQHGQKLFEVAPEPKMFIELEGSHGSGFWETGKKYRNGLQEFLAIHTAYQEVAK